MSEPASFSAAVQSIDHAVVLQGPALIDAERLVRFGLERLRGRDGYVVGGRLLELHRVLKRRADEYRSSVLGSDAGTTEDRGAVIPAPLAPEVLLTSEEAAVILKVTARQVRKLAPQLGARRSGRVHVFDRAEVEAFAARRAEQAGR